MYKRKSRYFEKRDKLKKKINNKKYYYLNKEIVK